MIRHVFYESLLRRVAVARVRIERPLDAAAHFLLPAWCAGCDSRLPWRPSPLGLCSICRGRLPAPPPAPGLSALDGLIAAWAYRPPIDEVVRRLKYGRLEHLAEDLAAGMAVAVARVEAHDYVTHVPIHWRRRFERGFDQAEILAASVARRIALPHRATLVRTRSTPPQVARSAAARSANVAGAFRCRRRSIPVLSGASVLLIDDVATTGATLEAAARALRHGGAARVTALVAALTPAFAGSLHPRYNRQLGLG
jgi:ComF family protein